jgi:hypothetical protein
LPAVTATSSDSIPGLAVLPLPWSTADGSPPNVAAFHVSVALFWIVHGVTTPPENDELALSCTGAPIGCTGYSVPPLGVSLPLPTPTNGIREAGAPGPGRCATRVLNDGLA